MFDELAQDPADAEDYDLDAMERHIDARGVIDSEDDAATLVGHRGAGSIAEDAIVFDIGDEDGIGDDHEREGLMKDD
ncbi:uncharacterized protein FIBRA_06622 [Fibroporia radiculosa]|uniref:Uncharacterized protein n=1 Tax=Fibroporia radiculosa TaxID=599839 RepID=J4HZE5_9APHY|nr:uncharacterized protein FIBRA_06622 [Fibroporia radiculosa]CCM04442.1 predicted protein [Fibroporia radiculosa]